MRLGLLAALLAAATAGCRDPEALSPEEVAAAMAAEPRAPLYEKLGGHDGIAAIVDAVLTRVVADPRIASYFAAADMPRLRGHLIDQIGQASGGPERYRGRDMKTAHAGMGIDAAAFDALLEDFTLTLEARGIGAPQRRALLEVLTSMRPDIVSK